MTITHLYKDLWIPWAEAHAVPETAPASWKNQCGKQVFESVSDTQGWEVRPKVTGPTAAAVRAASGWLNPNWAAAPIGAFHWWTGGPGHVGQDLCGGGEIVSMATTYPLIWEIHTYLGVQSVPGYKGPYTYVGWSTNYGGGIPKVVPEPMAAVAPTPPADTIVFQAPAPPVVVPDPEPVAADPVATPEPITPAPPVAVPVSPAPPVLQVTGGGQPEGWAGVIAAIAKFFATLFGAKK